MTPVWLLYLGLKALGGPSAAEGFEAFFQLSHLGHNYPNLFAACNTAALAGILVYCIRKVTMVTKP